MKGYGSVVAYASLLLVALALLASVGDAIVRCNSSDGSCYSSGTSATCSDGYECTCSGSTQTCTLENEDERRNAGIALLVIGCVFFLVCLPCMIIYLVLGFVLTVITFPIGGIGGILFAAVCFPCTIIVIMIVVGAVLIATST